MGKNWFIKDKISDERFIEVCNNSQSMSKAGATLGIHINSLRRRAKILECYKPNPSGKGIKKPYNGSDKIPLNEILEGKHPSYQTFKLKNRLLKEHIFENKCSECGLTEWNKLPLNCELDHINGDRTNHILTNLRMICPNCHSQTDTYRSKNTFNKNK